jgi:hypothetical protein
MQLSCFETKLPNLMLKTQLKQLIGSLLLDITLPDEIHFKNNRNIYKTRQAGRVSEQLTHIYIYVCVYLISE